MERPPTNRPRKRSFAQRLGMVDGYRPVLVSPFTRPPPATLAVMVATGVVSVLAMTAAGWTSVPLARSLMCRPLDVVTALKVWTPVTYLFAEVRPLDLLLHIVITLWMFAAPLERQWGSRRFVAYFFATGTGAAVLTCLLTLAFPGLGAMPLQPAYVVGDAILLAWVLGNWDAQVFFFVIPMKAQHLLAITLGLPLLFLLLGYVALVVPVFLALAIGYLLAGGRAGPRRLWLRARAGLMDWQLRRRTGRLRVVTPPPREGPKRYLN